jgi:hypothetical protein
MLRIRGACRHKHGVFGLEIWRREIADIGRPLVARQKHHIARACLEALYDIGWCPMFQQDRWNSDVSCERPSDFHAHTR